MADHQSQMPPADNKFHQGNGADGKHYWLTPPDIYANLDDQYLFDFDPCPHPKPENFDGLTCEWGQSNYVNPPFGSIIHEGKKKGPTAWVRKALAEQAKGKHVVLVYPVDKWVLMLVAAGAKISNLGDVRWLATEDGSAGKGNGPSHCLLRAGAQAVIRSRPLRRGAAPKKRTPIKKRNPKRVARLFAEDFGGKAYLEFIHGLPCAICGAPCELTEAAHLTSRGAGGKADVIVPLCGTRWGILGCHAKFDAHCPSARAHEPRLRSLAKQLRREFLAHTQRSNDDAT